ncbi:MAG: hypothetical protein RMJ88_16515 [Thermogemmata sp.]|nr:hypothetical protein [Thermogemmata sp.]
MDPLPRASEPASVRSEANSSTADQLRRLLERSPVAESGKSGAQELSTDLPHPTPSVSKDNSLGSLASKLKPPRIPGPVATSTLGVPPTEVAVNTPNTPINRPHTLRRVANLGVDVSSHYTSSIPVPPAIPAVDYHSYGTESDLQAEILRIHQENKELRKVLEEVKIIIEEAQEREKKLLTQLEEYGKLLTVKEEQIQQLCQQLAEIEQQIAKGELVHRSRAPKTRGELEEWADELEREEVRLAQERKKLEEERRQLQEDEKALEKQMEQNEKQMARERALLARQRYELERLYNEIRMQLDLMQRGDGALQEQLAQFRRRAQENMPPSS